jgi:predicted dehydrogenase
MKNTRRNFIKKSSIATLASITASNFIAKNAFSKNTLAGELKFALIGCKGMGFSNLQRHIKIQGVECVALCDVDQSVLDARATEVEKMQGKAPQKYNDYRKLLEDKSIDYVIIGSPDHWHCLMAVHAMEAGKHIYVEKPIALYMEECNVMLNAAKKLNKIVQVGQWQRSGPHYDEAIKMVHSGMLGQIRLVKVWAYQGWMKPVPVVPNSAPPAGVDYKMWLGPAQTKPFNENRFHFNFRWFWDYAGGLMTDWGVHEIDIALYAMKAKAPISVMASGGKFAYPDDASETPDTLQTVFQYDGFNMLWEHATGIDGGNYGLTEGISFIGNEGTLVVHRGGWELIPEVKVIDGKKSQKLEAKKYAKKREDDYVKMHAENFVEAIRKNDPKILKCGIETGSIAALNAQMGNIAFKLGRRVYWDAKAGNFGKDLAANALMKAKYHNGWKLPKY